MADDVARLASKRHQGENAEIQLRQFTPMIEELQKRYYQQLVSNTSAAGEVDDSTVYKMVALNDLVLELKTMMRRGKEAARKLDAE